MATRIEPAQRIVYRDQPRARYAQIPILLVVILASALFASFISPQISLFGRGLRLSLPLVALLSAVIFLTRPYAFRVWGRYGGSIVLGFIYVATGAVRYLFDPLVNVFQNFVVTAAVCVLVWMMVLLVRKGFPEAIEPIRWLTLITLGVSLGMGIPLLLEQPSIARLTMGNPMADIYATELYLRGVANYSWYTFVAIAFPVIANWLYNNPRRVLLKLIGWILLLAACIATMFSTFTMAAVLLILGIFAWLVLVAATTKRREVRLIIGVIILGVLFFLPTLILFGSEFEPTQFVIAKGERLVEGMLIEGALEGDETGRTQMFVDTMETFLRNPIFGAWGLDPNFYIGGHSSWADTLGTLGLFGLLLWMGFVFPSLRRGKQPLSVMDGTAGGTLSWILLLVGGVLNPTFFSAIGLGLLWLFDDGAPWGKQDADRVIHQHQRK